MKRRAFAVIAVFVMLAFTVPLFATDDPPPPSGGGGGCTGPDCR